MNIGRDPIEIWAKDMKKHKDLLEILRANKMRITPARRILLQFILDHKGRQIPLKEFYAFMEKNLPGIDRSSVYRYLKNFVSSLRSK